MNTHKHKPTKVKAWQYTPDGNIPLWALAYITYDPETKTIKFFEEVMNSGDWLVSDRICAGDDIVCMNTEEFTAAYDELGSWEKLMEETPKAKGEKYE